MDQAVIGIDVGGTTLAGGLVRPDGAVLSHLSVPTHGRGAGSALAALLEVVERLLARAREQTLEVSGIGIGVPGAVDVARGLIGPGVHYVPELSCVPLGDRVAERAGVPVYVDNDVNVLALGEWLFGAGRGARSMVLLAVGTGVGGGIILEGRLVRGAAGFGGELGHVPINYDGRDCVCGGRGCLKAYVSGTDIAAEGSRRLGRFLTASGIFDLAHQGDRLAMELVDEVSEALAAGLAVVVNGLNPERLLIGGGVAESLRARQADILARLRRYAYEAALAATHVEILSLGKTATVRGGAALVQYENERRRGSCR